MERKKLPQISGKKQKDFNRVLFTFYQKNGRRLPWRETKDPYRILVSEIMLQQTQVDRVLTKYELFLHRFPDLPALARATLGDVLRAWEGLGYNRRAKYLWVFARSVVSNHRGIVPRSMEALMELPGIGQSTAAGIMAFAFDAETPMIDTNARRIFHRVFFPEARLSDRELFLFASGMIPKGRGREWNYAMLDIAATRCTARNHRDDCPLGRMHGPVTELPKKKRTERFEDSDRYQRGKIIGALREANGGLHLSRLQSFPEIDPERLLSMLTRLKKEGMITVKGGRYTLPS